MERVKATIDELRNDAKSCRRCILWKNATQTIFGEGPPHALMVFVGEQPGDKEDRSGRPFVGPAGMILNQAIEAAGIDRRDIYVTNAVKHFKFEQRGKRRLHKKPSDAEIEACRWWLDGERHSLKPELVVALGATAARALFRRTIVINRVRGKALPLADGSHALVTIHPSFILRQREDKARRRLFTDLAEDLITARQIIEAGHRR